MKVVESIYASQIDEEIKTRIINDNLRKLALLLFLLQKPLPTGHLISSDEEILGRLWDAIDGPTSQIDRQ